jgi:hypothetical protein
MHHNPVSFPLLPFYERGGSGSLMPEGATQAPSIDSPRQQWFLQGQVE